MRKILFLNLGLLLMVGSQCAQAQQEFVYCTYDATTSGGQPTVYIGTIFTLPANSTDYTAGKTNTAFHDYVVAKYPNVYDPDTRHVGCEAWASYPDAARARQLLHDNDIQVGYRAFYIDYTYAPKATNTPIPAFTGRASTVIEQKTEPAALYDAQQHAPQAIPYQSGKTFFVNAWGDHACKPRTQMTKASATFPTVMGYRCTVTFTYSENRNPQAFTTIGEGATQDAALDAARLNHPGVSWDPYLCVETSKSSAYGSASHQVGDSGSSTRLWVCTIGYKSSQ